MQRSFDRSWRKSRRLSTGQRRQSRPLPEMKKFLPVCLIVIVACLLTQDRDAANSASSAAFPLWSSALTRNCLVALPAAERTLQRPLPKAGVLLFVGPSKHSARTVSIGLVFSKQPSSDLLDRLDLVFFRSIRAAQEQYTALVNRARPVHPGKRLTRNRNVLFEWYAFPRKADNRVTTDCLRASS
jgi:hypothetical protein